LENDLISYSRLYYNRRSTNRVCRIEQSHRIRFGKGLRGGVGHSKVVFWTTTWLYMLGLFGHSSRRPQAVACVHEELGPNPAGAQTHNTGNCRPHAVVLYHDSADTGQMAFCHKSSIYQTNPYLLWESICLLRDADKLGGANKWIGLPSFGAHWDRKQKNIIRVTCKPTINVPAVNRFSRSVFFPLITKNSCYGAAFLNSGIGWPPLILISSTNNKGVRLELFKTPVDASTWICYVPDGLMPIHSQWRASGKANSNKPLSRSLQVLTTVFKTKFTSGSQVRLL